MCCLLVEQPCWQFNQRSKFESHRDSCWWKWSYGLRQPTRMFKFQPCRVNWGWKYFYRIGSRSFHSRSVDRNSKFEFESHIEQKLLLIVIQPSFLSESLPGGDSGQVLKTQRWPFPNFFRCPSFRFRTFFSVPEKNLDALERIRPNKFGFQVFGEKSSRQKLELKRADICLSWILCSKCETSLEFKDPAIRMCFVLLSGVLREPIYWPGLLSLWPGSFYFQPSFSLFLLSSCYFRALCTFIEPYNGPSCWSFRAWQ